MGAHRRSRGSDVRNPAKLPQAKGFPALYKGLSPVRRLAWLKSDVCKALVSGGGLQQSQVSGEERKLKKKSAEISHITPTPARLSDFENGEKFPPVPDDPLSKPIKAKPFRGVLNRVENPVLWPSTYVSAAGATYDRVCYDTERLRQSLDLDAYEKNSSSPTTQAMRELESSGAILSETPLPTEDTAALKRQIKRYHAGMKTTLLTIDLGPNATKNDTPHHPSL
jgi:hypothetical protein